VRFKDFLRGMLGAKLRRRPRARIPQPAPILQFQARNGDTRLTVKRLFERLNGFLSRNTVVVADVGDALFGATDLFIRERTEFLAPAYYTSMGFAVPACVGAQLANPKLRPLVLVGDGAFQMTGMELATIARYKLNPVVVVLNNGGYGTERHMQDGPYNDVWPWEYWRLPEILGAGRGFLVKTENELDRSLNEAQNYTEAFCLLDVRLATLDRSPALNRLASRMAKRI
jgi:TPP-dependent 2-oxoacid decarboxylase